MNDDQVSYDAVVENDGSLRARFVTAKDQHIKQCKECGLYGHAARHCPSIISGEKDAIGSGVESESPKKIKKSKLLCFQCGQIGHTSLRCPLQSIAPSYSGPIAPRQLLKARDRKRTKTPRVGNSSVRLDF